MMSTGREARDRGRPEGSTPRLLGVVLPLAAVLLFVALAWSLGVCTQDDAFISFRYARQLADGNGLVYNPGERVEGYTNFLWTVLFAAVIRLGGDPVPVSRALGIALGGALVLVTWVAARSLRERPLLRFAAPLLVALTPPLWAESAMGLETVPFALLVLLGCHRLRVELERYARVPTFALLFAAAAMTRPEGTLTFALACGCCVLARFREPRPLMRFLVRGTLLFALPVGAHVAWRLSYYGYPFPNTYYAKTGGGWEQVLQGAAYLRRFLADLWWLPLPFLAAALVRVRRTETLILFTLTAVYVLYVTYVGGDFKASYRFFIPVLAPMWIVAVTGVAAVRDGLIARGLAPRPAAAGAFALALLPAAPMALGFEDTRQYIEKRRQVMADPTIEEVAAWVDAQLPPGEYLAQASAGRFPYLLQGRVIDMWGLTDEVIARSPNPEGHNPGHLRSNPAYLLERRPYFFILSPRHGPKPLRMRGFRPRHLAEQQLLDMPEFSTLYELVNQPIAGGYLYIFRRREA